MPESENRFSQKYFKANGRGTEVVVPDDDKKIQKIGEGIYGQVYQAEVQVGGHRLKMVVKDFNKTSQGFRPIAIARTNARQAIENYGAAKEAGVKVFTTYRLSEDGTKILMTNGNNAETVCVGSNPSSDSVTDFGAEKLEAIDHFENFVKNILEQASLAGSNGIFISIDAYFFLLNRKRPGVVEYVVGDLDEVIKNPTFFARHDLPVRNVELACRALDFFVSKNVASEDIKNEYFQLISDLENRQLRSIEIDAHTQAEAKK
ncbi:MAG: hypothetical protein Q7S66_04145 [bacterium]|nr:hypothetical protein [bacterium]